MSKCLYKLIIFDVDGTIVNTDLMLIETYRTLYSLYRKDKHDIDDNIIKTFSGPPIKDTLKREFPNENQDFMLKEYRKYSRPNYEKYVKTFEECKKVLLLLKKDGVKLAIATSKMHDATLYTLKLVDLENIFDLIIASDDVVDSKPNPECVNKIVTYFKSIKKEDVLFVGDTIYDVKCANNAHVDCAIMKFMERNISNDAVIKYSFKSFKELYEGLNNG